MTNPSQRYLKEMHEQVGFFATWLPGDILELGDVGVFEKGRLRKRTTLKELNIPFEVSQPGPSQSLNYTSKHGTNIDVDTSAAAPPPFSAAASIKINFSQEGAFLFNASEVRNRRLENRLALAAAILDAYKAGKWQKEWVLVDSLHEAECATVIVSEDSAAGLAFQANSNGPLGALPLANPQVKVNVSSSRGRMIQVVAGRDLRPLYSCMGVKTGWFSDPTVETVRGSIRGPLPFVRPDIDDLINS